MSSLLRSSCARFSCLLRAAVFSFRPVLPFSCSATYPPTSTYDITSVQWPHIIHNIDFLQLILVVRSPLYGVFLRRNWFMKSTESSLLFWCPWTQILFFTTTTQYRMTRTSTIVLSCHNSCVYRFYIVFLHWNWHITYAESSVKNVRRGGKNP